jgi:hypothetical protein
MDVGVVGVPGAGAGLRGDAGEPAPDGAKFELPPVVGVGPAPVIEWAGPTALPAVDAAV